VGQAYIYFSLLGLSAMGMYLAVENGEELLEQDVGPEDLVNLTVLDMSPVYAELGDGRPLTVICRDYDEAQVEICDLTGGTLPPVMDFGRVQSTVSALDDAFEFVFDYFVAGEVSLGTQMALAYGMMDDVFFESPPFHFGQYLELSEHVAITMLPYDSILWRAGEDPRDEASEVLRELGEDDSDWDNLLDDADEDEFPE